MDPLSTAASVVGVAVPALQCVQQLRKTIQAIHDAPSDIASLGEELVTVEQAITSVQEVTDQQWQFLGDLVVTQSKTGMTLCEKSCSKFQAAVDHWTRHSEDGKLSWRDRTTIGLFRQEQIQSTSSQLQNCKVTLTSIVTVATLRSSLQQASANEEMMRIVSAMQADIAKTLSVAEKKLEEVNDRLKKLEVVNDRLKKPPQAPLDEVVDEPDVASAKSQVEVEKFALQQSLDLLKTLYEKVQSAAKDIRKAQGQAIGSVSFGAQNHGVQVGNSNGGITFNSGFQKGNLGDA